MDGAQKWVRIGKAPASSISQRCLGDRAIAFGSITLEAPVLPPSGGELEGGIAVDCIDRSLNSANCDCPSLGDLFFDSPLVFCYDRYIHTLIVELIRTYVVVFILRAEVPVDVDGDAGVNTSVDSR